MSEEIVRRLRNKQSKNLLFINESINEEDETLGDEEESGVDTEDSLSSESDPLEDDSEEGSSSTKEKIIKNETPETNGNPNPLDNIYAVKFELGDRVALAYANGSSSDMKGTIEGYDKEGFYRVKWDNDHTSNGMTDILLTGITFGSEESNSCICGGTDLVIEGKYVVCDRCGRKIRESTDQLTLADKSRKKDKKLIRSEAHPVSTVLKPSVSECIKSTFKKTIKEDLEEDIFSSLKSLSGSFWTKTSEIIEDIEDLGYEVLEINSEYVLISKEDEDGNDKELMIPLGGTSRTMTLDLNRSKLF